MFHIYMLLSIGLEGSILSIGASEVVVTEVADDRTRSHELRRESWPSHCHHTALQRSDPISKNFRYYLDILF
ncbi:hypothetical protein BJ165DRAFT_181295 [Panaeolus papilionaceus]|nr:hypothetical protein BJ165DRAFT_181295 [Panaeolus papilionaceus]